MTLAEITRAMKSKSRILKQQAQQQALFDYIHADMVGRSVGRFLCGEGFEYPTLEQAYSSLFEDRAKVQEDKRAQLKAELSALRFKQYADFHNKKFK